MDYDITAVLNLHREGLIAKPSVESFMRSAEHAKSAGYDVELIAILDRSDSVTSAILGGCGGNRIKVYETNFGDLGKARNFASINANGKFIALLDGDDLWGVDWLTKALQKSRNYPPSTVWHPEINIFIGEAAHVFKHIDMDTPEYSPAGLFYSNFWTSLSFSARATYLENPYPDTDVISGIGFEDWAWNMETIAKGITHKVVEKTAHIIRRKDSSLSKLALAANAVPRPNDFFEKHILPRKERSPNGA